jgi:hypothetical protein
MLSVRLVQLIENHAEELTRGLLDDLKSNTRTPGYHGLPREELRHRVYNVYRNLGRWLNEKTDEMIKAKYSELGQRRCQEGIPVNEVVYALILTKYHLRDYIHTSGLVDSAVDLYQEQQLQRSLGQFFDKAIYYTVRGYEETAASMRAAAPTMSAH